MFRLALLATLVACGMSAAVMSMNGNAYNFGYSTGDLGGHTRSESGGGDGTVSGQYSYVDPNGNLRQVSYRAGPNIGFQAFGDVGVDKKTAQDAAAIASLAPKAPAVPSNPAGWGPPANTWTAYSGPVPSWGHWNRGW